MEDRHGASGWVFAAEFSVNGDMTLTLSLAAELTLHRAVLAAVGLQEAE